VFSKTSSLRSEKLLSGLESEIVQSLSEFRVLVQRINVREQRKKEHKQLYRFLPQTGSSLVPLALPRRVPLKCNVKLQVAQSHKIFVLVYACVLLSLFFKSLSLYIEDLRDVEN